MKYLLLIAALFVAQAQASATAALKYSCGASHMRINQNLFGSIELPQDALQLRCSYLSDSNVGIRLGLARSTERSNNLFVKGEAYTNKIKSYIHTSIFYKYEINDRWSVEPFIGYVDYDTEWTVNGELPHWSTDSDSDITKGLLINYKYSDSWRMFFGYSDLYEKHKKDYGRETTRSYEFGLAFSF
tara:strand:- start:809 stop:1366 length:558 start_codon:yes stop_codon:yes gene_type:complete